MGMPIVVDVRDADVDDGVLDEVFDWLRFVDATFSTYKDDSEISRLNRGELALADAHDDVREVLDRCERAARRDRRLLRRRARRSGPSTRPGSSRAGRSTGRRRSSTRAGARNYAVNAGGDMVLRGRAARARWRVGIQHPLEPRRGREGRRGERSRGRDLGRVRARRPRRRPAHGAAAGGDPLGDDHRARSRDRRRVRDRGLRDGRGGRRLDGAAARLRGDDDPRRRARALDARLSVRRYFVGCCLIMSARIATTIAADA